MTTQTHLCRKWMKEISHQREAKYRVDVWMPICEEDWFLFTVWRRQDCINMGWNSVFRVAQRQSVSTGRHPVRVPVPPSLHIFHHQIINSTISFLLLPHQIQDSACPFRSLKLHLPIHFLAMSFCPLQLYGPICNQYCCYLFLVA